MQGHTIFCDFYIQRLIRLSAQCHLEYEGPHDKHCEWMFLILKEYLPCGVILYLYKVDMFGTNKFWNWWSSLLISIDFLLVLFPNFLELFSLSSLCMIIHRPLNVGSMITILVKTPSLSREKGINMVEVLTRTLCSSVWG